MCRASGSDCAKTWRGGWPPPGARTLCVPGRAREPRFTWSGPVLSESALSARVARRPTAGQPVPSEPVSSDLPAMTESVATVEQRYDRAGLWVAIVVTFGWYLAGVAPVVVDSWLRYGLNASGAVTWLLFAVLGVVAAVVVLRGGGRSPVLPLVICPILLAGSVLGSLVSPDGVLGHFDWPFTMVGWFAVLALWRRQLPELIACYAANVMIGGIILATLGEASRVNVGRFIALCCGISALQITVFCGSRMVTAMARRGAEAADELARTRSMNIAAEAVQAARRSRYETITGTVAHLLEGLAAGQLDLTDRSARQGIAVDLVAPAGLIPTLPVDVRRALTEPIIAALAATATKARITVIASPGEVVVAILADARLDAPPPRLHGAVESSHDAEGEMLWLQARWMSRSASPS